MTLRFFLSLWILAVFCRDSADAQQQAVLLEKIRESHAKIQAEVFSDVAVDIKWKNIRLPAGEVQSEEDRSYVIQGESRMMRDAGDTLASNEDYRFRINDRDSGKEIGYLEGKRRPNAAAEAYEKELGGVLLASMMFDEYPLVDTLEDEAFVVDSIQEDAASITILGKWQEGDNKFEDIAIRLDPNNLYQVTASEYKVRRPTYGIIVERSFSYANEPFDGGGARMPLTFDQHISELALGDAPAEEGALHQAVVYSGWTRAPNDPKVFRLSGYGFPEPDLDALNGTRPLLRILISISVGLVGLLLLLFGRRFFGKPKAKADGGRNGDASNY